MTLAVCVFCGSHKGHDEDFRVAARRFGAALAQHGWALIYGGGNIGLMGEMAHSALKAGGEVIGVIPRALLAVEVGLRDVTELIITDTLRERKQIMDDRADAFVALPGGFGTLEELIEVLTLRQLGYHDKPIIILNINGYYDQLLELFAHAHEQGFVQQRQLKLYEVANTVDEVMPRLAALSKEQS